MSDVVFRFEDHPRSNPVSLPIAMTINTTQPIVQLKTKIITVVFVRFHIPRIVVKHVHQCIMLRRFVMKREV
jgi:ectoine hydroxylase-related dioxygenase (phytanoyl-CoA dioxygenase family)